LHLIILFDTHTYTYTHSVGLLWMRDQLSRPLPDNTQHSRGEDIHASGGIRTHNPSKREAANPRLRLRDHWNGLPHSLPIIMGNAKW